MFDQRTSTVGIFSLTALLIAVLYLPYLGTLQLWREEPRRALIAEEMNAQGDYAVPRYMGEVYVAKPPLYNWLIVGVSYFSGEINEFSVRLSSFLCLLLLIGVMLFLNRQWLGPAGLTYLALALGLSPEFMSKATLGEIDMCFTLLVSSALWIWFYLDRRHVRGIRLWLVPSVVIAFAFLAKREPAFLFYYLGVGAYLLYQRRLLELFQLPHLISAGVTLLIVGVWIWQMVSAAGFEALLGSSVNEVVNRGMTGSISSTLLHLLTYPLELALALFPFSLMLLLFLHGTSRAIAIQQHGAVLAFAGITVAANFLVYWFISQSAVRYFLPMLPSVLVVCAVMYEVAVQTTPRWMRLLGIGVSVFALLIALLLLVYLYQEDLGLGVAPTALLPRYAVLSLALGAVALGCWLLWINKSARGKHLLLAFCGLMLIYRAVYYDALLPSRMEQFRQERDVKTFVASLYNRVPPEQLPVGARGAVPHEIWWYMNYGDIEVKTSDYLVTDAIPDEVHQSIAHMNFRGRDIFLIQLLPNYPRDGSDTIAVPSAVARPD